MTISRVALVFLLIFVVFSFAKASINATPTTLGLIEGDEFLVNISFSTNSTINETLHVDYNSSLVSIIYPNKEINFGRGGFSGKLEYKFKAINPGETKIIFEMGNETSEISLRINPRYVKLQTENNLTVEKGENFSIITNFNVMNANNVTLNLYYDKKEFTTDYDKLFVGSGSFSKNITIPFKALDTTSKENDIVLEVCSSLGCENKTVNIFVKTLEFNVSAESNSVGLGEDLKFEVDLKNFNYDNPKLSINYDKNWFKLYSEIKEVAEGNTKQKIIFRMNNDAKGCPNTVFKFKLEANGSVLEKEIKVSIKPYSLVSLAPEKNIVGLNEKVNVDIKAKAFGLNKTMFALVLPRDNLEVVSSDFKYETLYTNNLEYFSQAKQKDSFLSKSKYIVLLSKQNGTCLNYEGSATLKVKDKFENLKGELTLAEIKNNKIINKTTKEIATPDATSQTGELSFCPPSLFSIKSYRRPCIPVVCPSGFTYVYQLKKCISNDATIVCPADAEYNSTTKRCEIYPEVKTICNKGIYNPETDMCEYHPNVDIVCQNGEYLPSQSNKFLGSVNFSSNLVGDKVGDFVINDIVRDNKINEVDLYLKYNFSYGETYNISLKIEGFNFVKMYKTTFNYSSILLHEEDGNPNYAIYLNDSGIYIYINSHTLWKSLLNVELNISKGEGMCIWHPPESPICERGNYNQEENVCEFSPEEKVVCERGEYNSETNMCEFYPKSNAVCSIGIYNSTTEKCQFTPSVEYVCSNGTYNPSSNKCEIYPNTSYVCINGGVYDHSKKVCVINVTDAVCDNPNATFENGMCVYRPNLSVVCGEGVYNSTTDTCQYSPIEEPVCNIGIYNSSTDTCQFYPNVDYVCDEGEYNPVSGLCEVTPNISHTCEFGAFSAQSNACVVNTTEIVCSNPNATYNNGTCVYTPNTTYSCNVGTYDSEIGACVYTPNTTAVCEKGVFDSEKGLCVFSPNVTIECEKGNYDPNKDTCVYKPNVTVLDVIELSAKVGEVVSITTEIDNPTGYTISGISTSLTPEENYTLVNSTLNSTELGPNETAEANYMIKFNKTGDYNLTLKVEDEDGGYSIRKYHFNILPNDSLITGFSVFTENKATISLLILFLSIIGYFQLRKIV